MRKLAELDAIIGMCPIIFIMFIQYEISGAVQHHFIKLCITMVQGW